MALIEWTAALDTGDERIDEQHRILVQAFNDLEAAVASKRGRDVAGKTLLFLVGNTVKHFQMEEKLMEEANYPATLRHKKLHHDLVVQVSALMAAYSKGLANLNPDVMGFLLAFPQI